MNIKIESHKEVIPIGSGSYKHKYQTINDVKCGTFSKTYRQTINENDAEEKFIHGEYFNNIYHNKYLVYYDEYSFIDDHDALETRIEYKFGVIADITFYFGKIMSWKILVNGESMTKESDHDESIKKMVISLLDLSDDAKEQLYTEIFVILPNEVLPNLLNRSYDWS